MSSSIRVTRICEHCGKSFEARTTVTRFCSDVCAKRAYKARKREEKVIASDQETRRFVVKPVEEVQRLEFLTVPEAAKLIRVSRRTIYRLIGRGEIQVKKVGRRSIIPRSAIDKFFSNTP